MIKNGDTKSEKEGKNYHQEVVDVINNIQLV